MCKCRLLLILAIAAASQCLADDPVPPEWRSPRAILDRSALDRIASNALKAADRQPKNASLLYTAALAESVRAEVIAQQHDKKGSGDAASTGIEYAQKAVDLNPKNAEYHRILGTLCGQTIPANLLYAMRYGHCALNEVTTALQLDPRSSMNWLSKGVGYYYLPASFGGGPDQALKDVNMALHLDSKNVDAWLWKGVILRKLNNRHDAKLALWTAHALDPARVWTKQQLAKTPDD
jgi:tetratricopeptide (TPR) repeat protein